MLAQKKTKRKNYGKHGKTHGFARFWHPCWSYVGPALRLCWSILGLCWPILGLSWPILGLCWPNMREETQEDEQKFKRKQKCRKKNQNPMLRTVRPRLVPGSPQVPPRFPRGCTVSAEGGRRQGGRASITFGYYRRPPARARASRPGPAPGFKGYRPLPPTPGKKIRGRRRGKDNWDIASAAVRLKDLWSDVGRKDRNAVRKDFSWNQVQHIRNWTISNWMMTNEAWKTEKINWESKIGIGDDVRKGVEAWIAMSFESN